MKRPSVVALILFVSIVFARYSESTAATLLRGFIGKQGTLEPVSKADIALVGRQSPRAASDSTGHFTLQLPDSAAVITVSHPMYRTVRTPVIAVQDTLLTILLEPRMYDMEEVIVTTGRIPHGVMLSSSPVSIIGRDDISRSTGGTLASVLSSEQSLFIKDYGSASALKTVSQRGLGAEHTLLLLNGIPLNSMQNGFLNLGTFPVEDIERVEVVRGGQSAAFGANAVAGVINVITQPRFTDAPVQMLTSIGSFGTHRLHLSGAVPLPTGVLKLGMTDERGRGDYEYIWQEGQGAREFRRMNNDHQARVYTAAGNAWLGSTVQVQGFSSYATSESGAPGAVWDPAIASTARQRDVQLLAQAGVSVKLGETSRWETRLQYRDEYERYFDPTYFPGFGTTDNYFRDHTAWMEQSVALAPLDWLNIQVGTDGAYSSGEGNSLTDQVRRWQYGMFAATEVHVFGRSETEASLSLAPGLRFDYAGDGLSAVSPRIGVQWTLGIFQAGVLGEARPQLRASWSMNFRGPTFNELYYNGGGGVGNPGLKPERSRSAEIGGSFSFNGIGEHYVNFTGYLIQMQDRIIWIPIEAWVYAPRNFREVKSSGMELDYRWSMPSVGLAAQIGYSRGKAEKTSADFPGDPTVGTDLVYVPRDKLDLTLSLEQDLPWYFLPRAGIVIKHAIISTRFTSEDNLSSLPGYRTTNATLRLVMRLLGADLITRAEVENLFNTEYQVLAGYPMPLRSYRVSAGLSF
jgi:vitamin B12 transporter